MESLTKSLKGASTSLVLILAFVVMLSLSILIEFFLVLPTFANLGKTNAEIETKKEELQSLKSTVSLLRNQDKQGLAEIERLLKNFVPETLDLLNFATLNEKLAQTAGATVVSLTVTQPKTTAPSNVTTAPGVVTGNPSTSTTAVPTPQTNQVAPITISSSYQSSFNSLLSLLTFWFEVDRLVGVKDINITSQVGTGQLTYTVTYDLPTGGSSAKATVSDRVGLTEAEREKFEKLGDNINFVASPSANPNKQNSVFD